MAQKHYSYKNDVEFQQKLIEAIVNLSTPTRSSEIYKQSYLQSRSLAELVTFTEMRDLIIRLLDY